MDSTIYQIEKKAEEILMRMEYRAKYLSEIYNIIIEKTIDNIIIRSNYYELKMSAQNLSSLTNILFNSIDEAFAFLINVFNQNIYYIKGILSNEIVLEIQIYDMINGNPKEIELKLKENLEDKNYLIKELFNKYIKVEKDLNEIKFNNRILKEENIKLNQDNMNLKVELEFIKNNAINSIKELYLKLNNQNNMINQIQQQLNQFTKISNQINQIQNQIHLLSLKLNNQLSLKSINNIKSDNNISLKFQYKREEIPPVIKLECKPFENMKEIIERFREKINSDFDLKDFKFVFNGKDINQNSFDNIQSLGISNNATIFVIQEKNN